MTVRTVSDNASFILALKASQTGDTVLLAPGTYESVKITGLLKSGVLVQSTDPDRPAVLKSLAMSGSSGLTFKDVQFSPGASGKAAYISTSKDIVFDHVRVQGSMDGDPTNDGTGLLFSKCQNVTVRGSEFQQLYAGVAHAGLTGLTIEDCNFHHLRMDGIRGGGSSEVLIQRNLFTDFYSLAGDHEDAIQFWTANTTTSARDIVVRDNVIDRGDGVATQGIFFGDEVGLPYQNVRIENNLVLGAIWRGISVSHGNDVVILDNVVAGFPDQRSFIYASYATGLTLSGNTAMSFNLPAGYDLASSNVVGGAANDGGKALLDQWLARNAGLPLPSFLTELGTPSGVRVSGTAVNDVLLGGAGGDTLFGLGGSDRLDGGAGGDTLDGGEGYDYAVYRSAGSSVTVSLQDGRHAGDARGDAFVSIEGWILSDFDDVFYGSSGGEVVQGGAGRDWLFGDSGIDKLFGGLGDDSLAGGSGRDTIAGDAGDDVLTGGADADLFQFSVGSGHDRITDFQNGSDRLQLARIAGVDGFEDLTVTQGADGAVISWAAGTASVVLVGVAASDVDASDVLFG